MTRLIIALELAALLLTAWLVWHPVKIVAFCNVDGPLVIDNTAGYTWITDNIFICGGDRTPSLKEPAEAIL